MPSPSIYHVTHIQPKALYLTSELGRRGTFEDIEPLKKGILAEGLKTPLRVRLVTDDRFKIVHGRRRYMAVMQLIAEGHKERFRYIPCNIIRTGDDVSDAVEYLAVNTNPSLDLSLVGELVDFLTDSGLSPEEISLRTGVPREVILREARKSIREAASLVIRLAGRKGSDALPLPGTTGIDYSMDNLLAAICAETPNAAQRRRLAIDLVKVVEDYQARRHSPNQAAKAILGLLNTATGRTGH